MDVRVHWNLYRKCWSIQRKNDRGRWYVAFHADSVGLSGVKLKVSEAGRQRVLREKRKNVHAYAEGTLVCLHNGTVARDIRNVPINRDLSGLPSWDMERWNVATYNPYKAPTFYMRESGKPVDMATRAFLKGREILVPRAV